MMEATVSFLPMLFIPAMTTISSLLLYFRMFFTRALVRSLTLAPTIHSISTCFVILGSLELFQTPYRVLSVRITFLVVLQDWIVGSNSWHTGHMKSPFVHLRAKALSSMVEKWWCLTVVVLEEQ